MISQQGAILMVHLRSVERGCNGFGLELSDTKCR